MAADEVVAVGIDLLVKSTTKRTSCFPFSGCSGFLLSSLSFSQSYSIVLVCHVTCFAVSIGLINLGGADPNLSSKVED